MSRRRFVSGGGGVSTEAGVDLDLDSSAAWAELAIEHLQLSPRTTSALRRAGMITVADAIDAAESHNEFERSVGYELFDAVLQLRSSQVGGCVNWRLYWDQRNWRLHYLAASLPEFDRLAVLSGQLEVNQENLGNAGNLLLGAGVQDISTLIAGLRTVMDPVRSLGRGKLRELFERLWVMASDPRLEEPGQLAALPATPANCPVRVKLAELIADDLAVPIEALQIGPLIQTLRSRGLKTVGDLIGADLEASPALTSLPGKHVNHLRGRLDALENACEDNKINWSRFAAATRLPLIPSQPITSPAEMLNSLKSVLDDVGGLLPDDTYRDILATRLTRRPGQQSTLEEIASRYRPRVTRERVRQKEAKLLRQLSKALIWGEAGPLGIMINPTLSRWWQEAVDEFTADDEIGYDEFVRRLAGVWNVELRQISAHLPFIVAVVTGAPQMSAPFRAGARLNPLLHAITAETAAIPIARFRLGRAGRRLGERNVMSLGQLIKKHLTGDERGPVKTAIDSLSPFITETGAFDWKAYATDASLQPLPRKPPSDYPEFLDDFRVTVGELVASIRTGRARQIFELRTARSIADRLTLAEAADRLKCHAPTVKREETLLLEELHDVVVEGEYGKTSFWLDRTWLGMCLEARNSYEAAHGDYARFLTSLERRWQVSRRQIEQAVPGLWAIFNGYPEGRRGRRGVTEFDWTPTEQPIPIKISLRGFRRVH
jgi:hypothetical protein